MVFSSFEDFLGSIKKESNTHLDDFRQDLFARLGVPENTETMKLYGEAWKTGHVGGLQEVAIHFRDLVKAFQEAKVL